MREGVYSYKFANLQHAVLWKNKLFYKDLKDLAYFVEGHTLQNTMECLYMIFVSFFYLSISILKFTFLMNLIMESQELKLLYYKQAISSLSWFHFLHILQWVPISHFHNNEYIISGLTRGVTNVSGICSFKKQSIKIIRFRKEIALSLFHSFLR